MTYKKIDYRGIILESFQKSRSLTPCQNIFKRLPVQKK